MMIFFLWNLAPYIISPLVKITPVDSLLNVPLAIICYVAEFPKSLVGYLFQNSFSEFWWITINIIGFLIAVVVKYFSSDK